MESGEDAVGMRIVADESVCLSRPVGEVANLPQFWQVGNLPHVEACCHDVSPFRTRPRKAEGR